MIKHIIAIMLLLTAPLIAAPVFASETIGTIDSGYKYAWGENLGWINLRPDNGGVIVADSALSGYGWSAAGGWINFSADGGGVTNTSEGALGGSAWSSRLGWISFDGITINSDGRFAGSSGNEESAAGRITFSCDNCDARTDWRPQSDRAARQGGTVLSALVTYCGDVRYGEWSACAGDRQSRIIIFREPAGCSLSAFQQASLNQVCDINTDTSAETEPEIEKPKHIETYDQDLTIDPDQSGRYVKDTDQGFVIVEVPAANVPDKTTFYINLEPLSSGNVQLVLAEAKLANAAFYNVFAKDQNNILIHAFAAPLTISLPVPPDSVNPRVYWFNEAENRWVLIPGAVFKDNVATFQVDHLTKFAIFGDLMSDEKNIFYNDKKISVPEVKISAGNQPETGQALADGPAPTGEETAATGTMSGEGNPGSAGKESAMDKIKEVSDPSTSLGQAGQADPIIVRNNGANYGKVSGAINLLIIFLVGLIWLVASLFLKLKKRKSFAYLLFFTIFYIYLYKVLDYTLLQFQSLLLLQHFLPNLMLRGVEAGRSVNLVPLATLTPEDVKTSLLNILMMVPFGFGLPFITNFRIKRVVVAGLLLSIVIEFLQFVTGFMANTTFRVADANDLIFNAIGVAVGYMLFVGFVRVCRHIARDWEMRANPILRYIADRPQIDK